MPQAAKYLEVSNVRRYTPCVSVAPSGNNWRHLPSWSVCPERREDHLPAGSCRLLWRRPGGRLPPSSPFRRNFSDSRVTLKRLQPIRLAETAPSFIAGRKQCRLFVQRPFRGHGCGPRFRAAARENLENSFLLGQPIPASEYLAHARVLSVASFSRNSTTRLAATAAR